MKRTLLKHFAVLGLAAILFSSCRKNDDDTTRYDTIQGRWMLTTIGADMNGNNQMDAGEMLPMIDSSFEANVVFHADRTGSALANFQQFPLPGGSFNWGFRDREQTLYTEFTGDTTLSHVETLNNDNMMLTNNQYGVKVWLGFVKQD